jgi:arabinofuranosyltransferase
VDVWDGWQVWLADHFVGVRQPVHKGFLATMEAAFPTREEGAAIPWEARAVFAAESAGVPGWVWPNVAILDGYGLSDRVIARNPATRPGPRRMAHERVPPEGYLACFRPNLVWAGDAFRLIDAWPRPTDEEIRACEAR